MILRIANYPDDVDRIAAAAQDFFSRTGIQSLMSDDPKVFRDQLDMLMAGPVDVLMAEVDDEMVAALAISFVPFLWNPEHVCAEEMFWWSAKDAPPFAALRILRYAQEHIADVAGDKKTVTCFKALTGSPAKVASVYERMGLTNIETTYAGIK